MALTYKSGTITEEGFKAGLVQNKEFANLGLVLSLGKYQSDYVLSVSKIPNTLNANWSNFSQIVYLERLGLARDGWRLLSYVMRYFEASANPKNGSKLPERAKGYYDWIVQAVHLVSCGVSGAHFKQAKKSKRLSMTDALANALSGNL